MLLAGSTRYLHHRVQSGDSPEGKTPPPWGVLCSQRGVDQLWAERVPGGLRECVTRQAGGLWQSGASPEGKTPPPCGVLCSQRGVDQLWAERVPGGLRECVTRQAGGLGQQSKTRAPPQQHAATPPIGGCPD